MSIPEELEREYNRLLKKYRRAERAWLRAIRSIPEYQAEEQASQAWVEAMRRHSHLDHEQRSAATRSEREAFVQAAAEYRAACKLVPERERYRAAEREYGPVAFKMSVARDREQGIDVTYRGPAIFDWTFPDGKQVKVLMVPPETIVNWCYLCSHPGEWHVEPCTTSLCECVPNDLPVQTIDEEDDMT